MVCVDVVMYLVYIDCDWCYCFEGRLVGGIVSGGFSMEINGMCYIWLVDVLLEYCVLLV